MNPSGERQSLVVACGPEIDHNISVIYILFQKSDSYLNGFPHNFVALVVP